jgi:hypothetical protein
MELRLVMPNKIIPDDPVKLCTFCGVVFVVVVVCFFFRGQGKQQSGQV